MRYYPSRKYQWTGSVPNGFFFGVYDSTTLVTGLRIFTPVGFNNAGGAFQGQPDGNSRHFTVKVWIGEGVTEGNLGASGSVSVPTRQPDFVFGANQTGDNPYTDVNFSERSLSAMIGVFDAVGYLPPFSQIAQFSVLPFSE